VIHLRRLHLMLGLLALIAFALTGQYMDRVHDHLRDMEAAPRLLFRSAHIYLLFSGLLNCVLGLARGPETAPWRRGTAIAGSLCLLATPPLFLLGFFRESWMEGLNRPYCRLAVYLSLAGVLFHLLAQTPAAFGPSKQSANANS
jgi:hypothetical protein